MAQTKAELIGEVKRLQGEVSRLGAASPETNTPLTKVEHIMALFGADEYGEAVMAYAIENKLDVDFGTFPVRVTGMEGDELADHVLAVLTSGPKAGTPPPSPHTELSDDEKVNKIGALESDVQALRVSNEELRTQVSRLKQRQDMMHGSIDDLASVAG